MAAFPRDIFTEPDVDPDTLRHLGPLAPLAGTWEGAEGIDEHPVADGTETNAYVERYELQPIDGQTNGPQLLYGLRYHVHVVKPGELQTFHDQVGYWLWEPSTRTVYQTLAIPRAQVGMASGTAEPDARTFTVRAGRGSTVNGICSNPFLEHAYRTLEWEITVTVNGDGTFSYEQLTLLQIPDRPEPFRHVNRNRLRRVAPPGRNPTAPF
ncbi:MAG TPA: heme-binding beta-barrel domain-containing protein [Anaeromyxobacteraceae bacterium]|nr:heme-binding beta-barrel domain-containing protein [Anaeromyxobacteraceae bacterium]